jgi:hypothetical protein
MMVANTSLSISSYIAKGESSRMDKDATIARVGEGDRDAMSEGWEEEPVWEAKEPE